MAQTYRMMLGTSGRQWEQLTVREDGTMMLYFHGTDRSVTQRVTLVEDGAWKGWLRSEGGSLYPGIESGRWQAVDCPAESAEIAESAADAVVVVTNTDCTDCTDNHAEAEECESPITNEPITNQPRPRRQRKPRKPRVALDGRTAEHTSDIRHQTSSIDHQPSDIDRQSSATLKAIGMVAAATVALFVIYETGLLIPLGLIGLATGGFLK